MLLTIAARSFGRGGFPMVDKDESSDPVLLTRRDFLKTVAAGSATAAISATGLSALLPNNAAAGESSTSAAGASVPISLPKGGGAIRGIGETFQPNLFTGTGNFSVPIFASPGRDGFGPQLSLQYSTGNGNGPFGLGWQLSIPRVTRKTEKGLPTYTSNDVFIMSGAEDLVPFLTKVSDNPEKWEPEKVAVDGHSVTRYRPRTEGLFARIERWEKVDDSGIADIHWRATTKENVTSIYGRSAEARIVDPEVPRKIYEWLLEETFDSKGNHILYEYLHEPSDSRTLDLGAQEPYEQNRRFTQAYIRRILYGNVPETLGAKKAIHLPERTGIDRSGIGTLHRKDQRYVFEVLFDYGDLPDPLPVFSAGDYGDPNGSLWWDSKKDDIAKASLRDDRFSSFRSGFEIRTLRRCKRVLMLHHFNEGELVGAPLVKSTNFTYGEDHFAGFSFLEAVTVWGYRKDPSNATKYLSRAMPPVTFGYSAFKPTEQTFKSVTAEGNDYPPRSLSDSSFTLFDIFGDGLPDVVNGTESGYFYWQNLGDAHIDRRRLQANAPAGVTFGDPSVSIGDMGGDGLPDLVVDAPPVSGFFEAMPDGRWRGFQYFEHAPTFDLSDRNTRLVDLTGDGLSDVLVTRDAHFLWYQCIGEEGYADPKSIPRTHDFKEFPDVYFDDPAGRVRLADMSGDGLSDIVMMHDGRIEYWPNLGHGRWGRRIVMKNAPRIGFNFDPKRLFLVDLDGTGCADVVYVDFAKVHFWFNRSGNGFGGIQTIHGTPITVDTTALQFADFYGIGTACLVWSYDHNLQRGGNYKVLDFCAGNKPHLLVEMSNNMGATTCAQYAPSTKFYLEDKKKGRPWLTNLPFPVQVLEKTEVIDHIGKTKLVTRYRYHHGYYDGREREFRGFGCVDQIDTEEFGRFSKSGLHGDGAAFNNASEAFYVPPVLTRNWFHTGIYFDENRYIDHRQLTSKYREEFFNPPPEAEERALEFEGSPQSHEAYRALRGALLRSEVYGLDGERTEDEPGVPYTVSESRHQVRQLQAPRDEPESGRRYHGIYLTNTIETLSFNYERNAFDPRIQHVLTLEVDDFGNELKQAAIGYGRRRHDPDLPQEADREKQTQIHITYTENRVTNAIDDIDVYPYDYRVPLPCETRTYELTGYAPTGPAGRYQSADFVQPGSNGTSLVHIYDSEIPYEGRPGDGRQRRPIEHVRTLYRRDDLTALLPLGEVESKALAGEVYKLAFTSGLLAQVYQRNGKKLLPEHIVDLLSGGDGNHAGYIEQDGSWWIPSGRAYYSQSPDLGPKDELNEARKHFFVPRCYRDPFYAPEKAWNTEVFTDYDPYDLLVQETRDALNNRVTIGKRSPAGDTLDEQGNDYRVLQPRLMMDPNRNCSEVIFDTLGLVVGTAVMGKPEDNPVKGDRIDGSFKSDLTDADIASFYDADDPHGPASDLLQNATNRILYDLDCFHRSREAHPEEPEKWQPVFAATLARETHVSDLGENEHSKIQISFSYSDGFGREIQKKIQAEGGRVPKRDEAGRLIVGPNGQPEMTQHDVSPRWVGSGWTIFNNKGKPVRQFEPFFTDTHKPDFDTEVGVSPALFYDPLERVVATLHPNDTYEKVVFDPWRQITYDVNDTVAEDPRLDQDIKNYVAKYCSSSGDNWKTWLQKRGIDPIAPPPDTNGAQPLQDAAVRTLGHADTPAVAHFDSLGRTFLTVADNGKDNDGNLQRYQTHIVFDIEGNQREVIDAKGRVVMRYDYDLLGSRIHQSSMEAGERWMLNDATGNPIRAWDSRGHNFSTTYDRLRRPIAQQVQGTNPEQSDPRTLNRNIVYAKTDYGEGQSNAIELNLRTRVYKQYDGAGVVVNETYDFKGNLLRSSRQVHPQYKDVIDWASAQPEGESFATSTIYDALNRPISLTAPDNSEIRPTYNEANLLNALEANLRSAPVATKFITDIDYNAKGQRVRINYATEDGAGISTHYQYDPTTFRLTHLYTRRGATFTQDCENPNPPPEHFAAPERPPPNKGCGLQNLHYTYDPVGNITHIRDDAQQTIYFDNQVVEPRNDYKYDAIYRLIQATGREHIGQAGSGGKPYSYNDAGRVNLPHPGDGRAMGRYCEEYLYDEVGNFLKMTHRRSCLVVPSWTRTYAYREASLLDATGVSNRLSSTTVAGSNEPYSTEGDGYDAHGNMLRMPHLQGMHWDFRDRLRLTQRQKINHEDEDGAKHHGEKTYYVYDAGGQRVRKVTERHAFSGQEPTRMKECIYVGGIEVYREYETDGDTISLAREALLVMDDKKRIALVEHRAQGDDGSPEQLVRYQVGNHLGSIGLELSREAELISYEEYAPYGSTSYQAADKSTAAAAKRYRYSEKERDEESGFQYYDARYYSAWLARFLSPDPVKSSPSLYIFARANPVKFVDEKGLAPKAPEIITKPTTPANSFAKQVQEYYSEVSGEMLEAGASRRATGRIAGNLAYDYANQIQDQFGVRVYEPEMLTDYQGLSGRQYTRFDIRFRVPGDAEYAIELEQQFSIKPPRKTWQLVTQAKSLPESTSDLGEPAVYKASRYALLKYDKSMFSDMTPPKKGGAWPFDPKIAAMRDTLGVSEDVLSAIKSTSTKSASSSKTLQTNSTLKASGTTLKMNSGAKASSSSKTLSKTNSSSSGAMRPLSGGAVKSGGTATGDIGAAICEAVVVEGAQYAIMVLGTAVIWELAERTGVAEIIGSAVGGYWNSRALNGPPNSAPEALSNFTGIPSPTWPY